MEKIKCGLCPRHCSLAEGAVGVCKGRGNKNGEIIDLNYGCITSVALDPIEKKPLYHFFPGNFILSVGSFGCNLKCPFCQNHSISMADSSCDFQRITPEQLVSLAIELSEKERGNLGIAFTYNEPLVGYEFVVDTARLVKEAGMKNVLVTNGCVNRKVFDSVIGFVDAMNIDLKCFTESYYRDVLKGDLDTVRQFITLAAGKCHVELTTLIIPGENDSDEEMRALSGWIAELEKQTGKQIPLHISRFFPMSRYSDRRPTPVTDIYRLADVAREKLRFVYEGNV